MSQQYLSLVPRDWKPAKYAWTEGDLDPRASPKFKSFDFFFAQKSIKRLQGQSVVCTQFLW